MPKRGRQGETPAAKRQRLLGQLARAVDRSSGAVVARRAASAVPVETKYFDVAGGFTPGSSADWSGTEVVCANYVQSDGTTVGAYTDAALVPSAIGAGYGQVNGNKLYIKQLRIRGKLIHNGAADQADGLPMATVRLVLVHDTQPNGAQAQGEDVFTDLGSAAANNMSFLAMGAGTGGRFRILKDRLYRLQPGTVGTDGTNTNSVVLTGNTFSFSYKPKKPIQLILKANSSTPTVASLSNHNIFMLAHADVASCNVTFASRCYYLD